MSLGSRHAYPVLTEFIRCFLSGRSKAEEANFSFLKANPPAKDLTKEGKAGNSLADMAIRCTTLIFSFFPPECERIVIYLLYQDVLHVS